MDLLKNVYLVSYQKQGSSPVVYVADMTSLLDTVDQALEESDGAPIIVSQAKTI